MTILYRIVFCFLSLAIASSAVAQTKVQPNAPVLRDDVLQLAKDVEQLREQQQQLVAKVDELKQVIQASGPTAVSGMPTHAQPPRILDAHGETFRGDSAARVAIVEYSDFECPYCGLYEREVNPRIIAEYIKPGKIRFLFRDLPLQVHSHAFQAARAARCAGEQGAYWQMHDSLYANQRALSDPDLLEKAVALSLDVSKFTDCLSSEKFIEGINKDLSNARQLGVEGTPTFFIGRVSADGDEITVEKRITGMHPYEVFKAALDEVLASESTSTDRSIN